MSEISLRKDGGEVDGAFERDGSRSPIGAGDGMKRKRADKEKTK